MIFWTTLLLDLPADRFDAATAFWEAVSGHERSTPLGDRGEFVDLSPPQGDRHLAAQRLEQGGPRVHLDFHVVGPHESAEDAVAAGATLVRAPEPGFAELRSPGGLPFCFIDDTASASTTPADWGDGLRSAVDQACIDVPAAVYDDEAAFWRRLTGWEQRRHPSRTEFEWLVPDLRQPARLLLQRLGDDEGPVRAHLDVATTDRTRETARHVALGAEVVAVHDGWTVLHDPAGSAYCITDRTPETRVPGVPVVA